MKPTSILFLILTAVLSASLPAAAYDFEVDGIQYRILSMTDRTCSVEKVTETAGSNINLSPTVEYRSREFNIASIDAGCLHADVLSLDISDLNLSQLPSNAFNNARKLEQVVLPSTLIEIGTGAFQYCSSLTSINLPESLVSIGKDAFYKCKELKSITIPPYITSIGSYAFSYCGLVSVVFDGREDSPSIKLQTASLIGDSYLFFHNSPISALDINRNIELVGYGYLIKSSLESLKVGEYATSIPERLNYSSSTISNLHILDRSTPLDLGAINSAEYLYLGGNINKAIKVSKVDISDKVTELVGFSGSTFESVILPQSIKSIGSECFRDCKSLKAIDLPKQLSTIPESCFSGCTSLKTVTIGESVNTIGDNAFNDTPLEFVGCQAIQPPVVGTSVFTNKTYIDATLVVPEASLSSYKDDTQWGYFFDIRAYSPVISLEIAPATTSLEIGTNKQLEVKYKTENPDGYPMVDFNLIWESSNPQVAKVSAAGEITAIEAGECVITVQSSSNPDLSSSCGVTVTPIVPDIFVVDGIKYHKIDTDNVEVVANDYNGVITIPNSVEYYSVIFNVAKIAEKAFSGCTELSSLEIPGSINSLADDLLNDCKSLKTLIINEGDKPLSLGCNTDLHLASSITPFPNPSDVDERRTGFRNGYYDGLFYGLPLEHIVINRNIELPKYYERTRGYASGSYQTVWNDIIYYSPFYGLTQLKSLEIGEKVTSICKNQIEAVVNAKQTTMYYTNFGKCDNIEVVVSNNPTAPIGGGFSQKAYENATLFLPNGGESSYKADDYWKNFSNVTISQYIPVTEITFAKEELVMDLNETAKLTATVTPDNASIQKLKWSSSAPTIAEVSDEGEIKSLSKEGESTITAYACDGSGIFASIKVTVQKGAAIDNVQADSNITIRVVDGVIFVDGLSDNSTINIYDLQGQLMKSSRDNVIALNTHGAFILKVGTNVQKVIL